MFGKKKNKKFKEEPVEILVPEVTVKTMPQKFRRLKDSTNKMPKIVGAAIMIAAVLGMVLGGAYLLKITLEEKAPVVNTNIEVINANQNINSNQNINRNQNININQNVNRNINTNTNANANVNSNVNTNVNTNTKVNTNVNVNTNTNINVNVGVTYHKGIDTDNDNLSDREEELYGTQNNKPDSDNDGYSDGEEMLNLYNPLGADKLAASKLIKNYENSAFSYEILYPVSWSTKTIDLSGREVMFISKSGEFIEVIIQDNTQNLSVSDWYLEQWPGVNESDLEEVESDNFMGVKSFDGLTVYLVPKNDPGEFIYVIAYNVGTKSILDFETTFEMMIQSFILRPAEVVGEE